MRAFRPEVDWQTLTAQAMVESEEWYRAMLPQDACELPASMAQVARMAHPPAEGDPAVRPVLAEAERWLVRLQPEEHIVLLNVAPLGVDHMSATEADEHVAKVAAAVLLQWRGLTERSDEALTTAVFTAHQRPLNWDK